MNRLREKTTATLLIAALMILAIMTTAPIVQAEKIKRVNFQAFAKGPGRLSFYSSSTGLYWEYFDESMVVIAGTSGLEDMGSWYRLTPGTVKVGGTILVKWTHEDKKYEIHLTPKVGTKTSGYIAWAFVIDHMSCRYVSKINGEVQGVSEGTMVVNLLTGWLNQITVTLDITIEGEPTVVVLYWYDYSADVFRINTKLV